MFGIPRTQLFACAMVLAAAFALPAQDARLDSLMATSLRNHPAVRAGAARVDAARAALRPAGALPDPMVMAGIENLPLGRDTSAMDADLPDMMTMRMLGVSQTVPFPGKLSARRRAAEQQVAIAEARLDVTRRQIAREISLAYYELAYLDAALQIIEASQAASRNIERAAEARYVAGLSEQRGVLDARVATTRFSEQLIALQQERTTQRALLAAAIGDSTPVMPDANVSERLLRVAQLTLSSTRELQDLALRNNPELRARGAEIAALTYELEVARKEYLPDFDFSVRYGQRTGRPDMISASVTIPVPIQKGRKQDELVRGAEANVAAARADLLDQSNRVRAEVAGLRADLERIRSQIALFQRSIIPQARAALESAIASLVTGKIELFSVIQRQTELLDYDLALQRLLAEFGQKLAQLESIVGAEVLP